LPLDLRQGEEQASTDQGLSTLLVIFGLDLFRDFDQFFFACAWLSIGMSVMNIVLRFIFMHRRGGILPALGQLLSAVVMPTSTVHGRQFI